MHWLQNYSAVEHSLGPTALVASFPISFLFWALAYKRMKGHVAASAPLLLMISLAVAAYRMSVRVAVSAAVLGIVSGLWPIGWIIFNAVFFYNLTVEAGQSEVAPRGLGSIVAMPVIAFLSERIDARYLLTFGFVLFAVTTLYIGSVTVGVSLWTLLVPILIIDFGAGFIFVPISTQAYGTLPREQIGAASGLYNLMRNIGGPFGVSLTVTLLTRRSSAHQSEITNYIARSRQQFQSALQTEMGGLATHFGEAHTRYPAELQL